MQWPLIGRESDLDHAIGLVEAGTGLALLGQAGVGKSRLLHELGDRAEQSGKAVVRTVATESTRSIPFAPFVELLPEVPSQDRLVVMGMALATLRERNRGRGLLLTVDDAHHLDSSSLAILIQAVSSGAATVCMTARSGERMEPDLVDMWTNGVIHRLDVPSLTFEQLGELVSSALGDSEPGLNEELWRLTHGNPLVLHELIEGAVDISLQRDDTGVWRAVGPLARSARLGDLVRSRVASLPQSTLSAMEVIALGAPMPVSLATRAGDGQLAELEAAGLIQVTRQADAPVVVPAHPMYGEIMVENMPKTVRASAFARLVAAATAEPGDIDPVRVALWQLESEKVVSAELAVAGASAALNRHDPGLAERLVRPVGTSDPKAALVLSRALSYQQRWQEAEEVLGGMDDLPGEIAGEWASVRAQNLAFGLGRVAEARLVFAAAADSETDPDLRARLLNERAMVSAISGDFGDTRAATESVLSDPASGELSRVSAYVTLTVAQAMTGDSAGLEEVVPTAIPMAHNVMEILPFARDQIEIMQVGGYLNAGRIQEAWEVAKQAIARPDRGEAMLPTWHSAAGLVLDAAGAQQFAAEYAVRGLESYAHADPFGLESQTRGTLALARGQMGDVEADSVVADLPVHLPAPRLSVWVDRGKAWGIIARGEIEEAVQILVDGGRHAVAGEHFAWAALCFHDAARVGRPDAVRADMEAMPSMPGADLIRTFVEHITALETGDVVGVAAVAARFTEMKTRLLAAEAWSQAASLSESESEACRYVLMSIALEKACGRPVTPALDTRPPLVSEREVETAMAAARGATSSEIAEQLFLSARTVENHLQSVYRKCAVSGRDELRELLLPVLESRIEFEIE